MFADLSCLLQFFYNDGGGSGDGDGAGGCGCNSDERKEVDGGEENDNR